MYSYLDQINVSTDIGQLLHKGEPYWDYYHNTDIFLLYMCVHRPSKHDIGQLWLEEVATCGRTAIASWNEIILHHPYPDQASLSDIVQL